MSSLLSGLYWVAVAFGVVALAVVLGSVMAGLTAIKAVLLFVVALILLIGKIA